jgi:hypothetical protein
MAHFEENRNTKEGIGKDLFIKMVLDYLPDFQSAIRLAEKELANKVKRGW